MNAIEFLKERRIYDDETLYNAADEMVGSVSELMTEYAQEQLKNCNLHIVMRSTLEQKEESYKEICAWFENEYSPAFTDEDEVAEWNKKATEINAQIKLLRFLISEYCA